MYNVKNIKDSEKSNFKMSSDETQVLKGSILQLLVTFALVMVCEYLLCFSYNCFEFGNRLKITILVYRIVLSGQSLGYF